MMTFTGLGQSRPREKDGTVGGAEGRGQRRASRRIVPPPRACIRNMWGDNGRRRAEKERYKPYINGADQQSNFAPGKQTFDFARQRVERSIQSRPPRVDYDIPLRFQLMEMEPDRLASPPPQPVPRHGVAERFRRRKSNARAVRFRASEAERCKVGTRNPDSAVVDLAEIDGSQDPDILRE
jgi:hypothetical protein